MGYFDERVGYVEEEEDPQPPVVIWTPKPFSPSSKHPSKHSPGTPEGRSKGGKARAVKLSPERRREIAMKAAQTRWAK